MASATVTPSGVVKTFEVGATTTAYQLMVLTNDGTIDPASNTAAQVPVGFINGERAFSAGEFAPVVLLNAGGTAYASISGTCSIGSPLHAAAAGQLATTQPAGAPIIGYALQAAADGDVIEVLLNYAPAIPA